MSATTRQSPAGYQIKLDGAVIRTMGALGDTCQLGIVGDDVTVKATSTPEPFSVATEIRPAALGTGQADVSVDGKTLPRLAAGDHVLTLPGPDIVIHVAAVPAPAPVPNPAPAPSPAPTDTMPTPPAGTTVIRLPAKTTSRITLKSNTWYAPAQGLTRAQVAGFDLPNGLVNFAVYNVDCIGNGAGYGINGTGRTGIKNGLFQGGSCRNYKDGAAIHGANIEGPCVHQNITFRNWRFMDTGGPLFNDGQGIYAANIDGLTLEECFGDHLGNGDVGIGTHFAYIAAGNRNVKVLRCFVSHAEAVGIQARGPLVRYTDPVNGDPGPLITGNVLYDCAIAIMVNGPLAQVRDNVILAGHHAKNGNTGGEAGVYGSVGKLAMTNNLRVHSPVKDVGTMFPAWANNPRSDYALQNNVKYQWGWSNPCTYTENTGNVDHNTTVVDLSDLVTRGRNGEPVAALVDEAQKRCRTVAGVN